MGTRFVVAVVGALLSASCSNLFGGKTTPTPTPTELSTGQWSSIASSPMPATTCTDFQWNITEVSGATGSGTFTAECLGAIQVSGTAQGTLADERVTWTAEAVGTAPDGAACPVSLSGTATYDGVQIRIPFSGTTCLGPVSGAEVLRKP